MKNILYPIFLLCFCVSAFSEQKSSITQYGITWNFDRAVEAGRFITGDWWVIGPLSIKSITPSPENNRNGSVLNPPAGEKQGYDDRLSGFNSELRAVFPLKFLPGQSLVSTASVEKIGVKTPSTVPGQYCRGSLRTAAVLTCLDKAPPLDAFRPAYVGTWKKIFTVSQLRKDIPKLQAPKSVPDLEKYERFLERIWLDHQRGWVNRMMHPLENMPDYGREITNIVSTVGLMCLLNDPDHKYQTLRLRFIQKGIDYYGTVLSDNNLWVPDGGHNSGRKWPILYAGFMLNDDGMKNVKATFQEDKQTYYTNMFHGKETKEKVPVWRITLNNPNKNHEEVNPSQWETYGRGKNNGIKAENYRKLNGPTWIGQAMAARLTGMKDNWNHLAFFDYVDRLNKEVNGSKKGFVKEIWDNYHKQADNIGKNFK